MSSEHFSTRRTTLIAGHFIHMQLCISVDVELNGASEDHANTCNATVVLSYHFTPLYLWHSSSLRRPPWLHPRLFNTPASSISGHAFHNALAPHLSPLLSICHPHDPSPPPQSLPRPRPLLSATSILSTTLPCSAAVAPTTSVASRPTPCKPLVNTLQTQSVQRTARVSSYAPLPPLQCT